MKFKFYPSEVIYHNCMSLVRSNAMDSSHPLGGLSLLKTRNRRLVCTPTFISDVSNYCSSMRFGSIGPYTLISEQSGKAKKLNRSETFAEERIIRKRYDSLSDRILR